MLDLKGLKCPLPVLRTQKAMRGKPAGYEVWVETTDPLAVIDIPAFCNEHGHQLVDTQTLEASHRFLIKAG